MERSTTATADFYSLSMSSLCSPSTSSISSIDSEQLEEAVASCGLGRRVQPGAVGFQTAGSDVSSSGGQGYGLVAALPAPAASRLPPARRRQAAEQVEVVELLDSDSESDGSWRTGALGTQRKRQVVHSSDASDSDPSPRSKEARSNEGPAGKQGPQRPSLPPYFAAIPGLDSTAAAVVRPHVQAAPNQPPPPQQQQQPQQRQQPRSHPSARPAVQPPAQPAQQGQQHPVPAPAPAAQPAQQSRAAWRGLALSAAAYKKQREGLAWKMFDELNRVVFEGKLPPGLHIKWNNRLATTAGLTHYKREVPADGSQPSIYSAHVELSAKVLDDVAKLERTLCHELCHVAAWLVNHTAKPPHGAVFKAWADRAMYFYPHLDITTCHQYDIFYPFRWQCTNPDCLQTYGRHSNSIDVARKVCGECRSRLAFLGRFSRDGSPAKQRAPSGFAAYVKENFSAAKAAAPMGTPQPEVMRRLGQDWAARQAQAGAAAGMAAPAGGPAAAAGGGGRQSTVASLLDELSLA